MFDSLKKHHIGIIITENQKVQIESIYKKEFITDTIQGTRVLFLKEPSKSLLLEYIVQEGRAKNLQLGFGHICYSVENKKLLLEVESYIKLNKLGYPVTKLDKSGSKECNWIKFFFIKNFGLIEFNVEDIFV